MVIRAYHRRLTRHQSVVVIIIVAIRGTCRFLRALHELGAEFARGNGSSLWRLDQ